MLEDKRIRVCLKCRAFMIVNPTAENQAKLQRFEDRHRGHSLITTDYAEIDNLECGKVHCEDEDPREKLHYATK